MTSYRDYQIEVTGNPAIRSYRWTVTAPDGTQTHSHKSYKAEWVALKEARSHIDEDWARVAPQPQEPASTEPAPIPGNVTGQTGWSKYSRRGGRDQVGGYLADSFGLTSPATAHGECHFCGQRLDRRGECDECR